MALPVIAVPNGIAVRQATTAMGGLPVTVSTSGGIGVTPVATGGLAVTDTTGTLFGPAVIPANTGLPVISGTTVVGQTLTTTVGTWSGTLASYTYQWKRGGVNIAGATSNIYTLVTADGTTNITCTVTATNPAGSASATSAAVGPITPLVLPANTVLPLISGTATVGQTLTVSNGTWTGTAPITYAYQWDRVVPVTGATFDPATVTDTALSGGNLTATHTTVNANSGARCSLSLKTTGKYYFEIQLIAGHGAFDAMGLINSAATYNNLGIAAATNCASVQRGGLININNVSSGKNVGVFVANDIAGIAVDLTAHLIWFRRNAGLWNNTAGADPATATGGLTIPSVSLAPGVCFVGTGTAINDAYTANFGASAFSGAVPSGFTAGWPA